MSWSLVVMLVACQEKPGSTRESGDGTSVGSDTGETGADPSGATASTGATGDTGVVPPSGPPLPRAVADVTAWGSLSFGVIPWSPDVSDLAITDEGGLCLSGSSWYAGYGYTAVDQYIPGEGLLLRIDPTGSRDLAFAGDGLFQATGTSGGTAVAAGPDDGCYLAVGLQPTYYGGLSASVLRVDSTGLIDPGFSPPVVDHGPGPEAILDLAALQDGGVLVLGVGRYVAYVDRFTADGALDLGWATGGEVQLPLASDCYLTTSCGWGSLAVQADGRVLVGFGHPAVVVALDPTGAVDPAYGTGGVAASTGTFRATGMGADSDGGAILAGDAYDGTQNLPIVEGLDPTGAAALAPSWVPVIDLDAYSAVEDAVVDDQGRILLAAGVDVPTLLRLGSDGASDPTWGTEGAVTWSSTGYGAFGAIAVAANGTVVAAGHHDYDVVVMALAP